MRQVLWETISERIPDLDSSIRKTIQDVVEIQKGHITVPSKSEIIDAIIDELRDDD